MSCLGSSEGFTSPLFTQVATEFPSSPIIIEHLSGIGRDESPPYATFRKIPDRAQYRNACIKIHGLGEICHPLMLFPVPVRFQNIPPFMRMAYDVFGASRMMWGSDFPAVAGSEGYRNALQWTMEHIPFRSEGNKERLLGKTALSLLSFAG